MVYILSEYKRIICITSPKISHASKMWRYGKEQKSIRKQKTITYWLEVMIADKGSLNNGYAERPIVSLSVSNTF